MVIHFIAGLFSATTIGVCVAVYLWMDATKRDVEKDIERLSK